MNGAEADKFIRQSMEEAESAHSADPKNRFPHSDAAGRFNHAAGIEHLEMFGGDETLKPTSSIAPLPFVSLESGRVEEKFPTRLYEAMRTKLPDERVAATHKIRIGEHEGYITVGMYEDGRPGEVFIKMSKQGSTVSGLCDALSIAISIGLQHGVKLSTITSKLRGMQFEPRGVTPNGDIRITTSIVDYIARWLDHRFGDNG